jgi:hypothetical protein
MDINLSDISIVVQGPIISETDNNLGIIRKFFPNSYIILSTWITDNYMIVKKSNYDLIILNNDPGSKSQPIGNVNRQIVSTLNGINKVKTKYVVKLRTDSILFNSNFLKYYTNNISKYNLFKNPILILSIFAKDPEKWQVLYHISDIFLFGLTTDLKNLFDIPLAENQFLTPEQYIFSCYLKNKGFTGIEDMYELTFIKILKSELYISNSFILIDYFHQDFFSLPIDKQILSYEAIFKKPFYDLYSPYTLDSIRQSKFYLLKRATNIYFLHLINYRIQKLTIIKIFKSIFSTFKSKYS